jgi:polyketide cyclase/dehydrase/lipid transport protein
VADHFGSSIVVDRPIEEVFAFLLDGENDKKFSKRIVEIEKRTDGDPDVGTVYASVANDVGIKQKHEFELTQVEAPTKIRWKELTRTPVYVTEGGYDLVPSGSGTELSFFNRLEGHGIGKLFAGFAAKAGRKGADDFAAAIKHAVEAS